MGKLLRGLNLEGAAGMVGVPFERGWCCAECLQGDILLAGVGTFGGDVDVLCAGG